ncbi:MAG: hypothetical protein GYB31_03650 [Bacteroidetes bacterium]|nr:hypothetical protein [Bacteroidota bacterium]
MKPILTIMLLFAFYGLLSFPDSGLKENTAANLACNDTVYVSLDMDCEAMIYPDDLIEGSVGDPLDYLIDIHLGPNSIPNPITGDYIGEALTATITYIPTGNSCWSILIPEDKSGPIISCPVDTIEVDCWVNLDDILPPLAEDNCSAVELQQTNSQVLDNNICDSDGSLTVRIWKAFDASGNEADQACKQYIRRIRPHFVDFPNDIIWSCTQEADFPSILEATPLDPAIQQIQDGINTIDASAISDPTILTNTGSGDVGEIHAVHCKYDVSYAQQIIENCGVNFDIIRTWTVFDWCSGAIITSNPEGEDNVQTIKVMDVTPPEILNQVSLPIPTDSTTACVSLAELPIPEVLEDCSDWQIHVFTPVGEAIYANGQDASGGANIPPPGLEPGTYTLTFVATNTCGLVSEATSELIIYDQIAPVTLCDEITEITLDSDGSAIASANVFDDGSYDNCCLDQFLVRRMDSACNPDDLTFGPSVSFCCEDEANNPIWVAFRGLDCYENFNECMVQVYVHDKLPPTTDYCPPATNTTCDVWEGELHQALDMGDYSVLDQFGTPIFHDNCGFTDSMSVSWQVNVCGYGQISRTWLAMDEGGTTPAFCNQIIQVNHVSDWGVSFPGELLAECTDTDIPDFGEPTIFFEDCELIGISFEDQLFNVVPDACYKIIRTWTAINWCIFEDYGTDAFEEYSEAEVGTDFDGDGDQDMTTFYDGINNGPEPDGYIVFKQIIKVVDNEDPELSVEDQFFCIEGTDCGIDISLEYPDVADCSLEYEIEYTSNMPNDQGNGQFEEVPPGIYEVNYEVWDACGNVSYINQEIEVQDCKLPTPICQNVIDVVLMQTGELELPAVIFDAGSYDNCEGPLYFSYSANVSDSLLWLDCDNLGQINVEFWVTDQYGNQDFCETYFFLFDNEGFACQALPLVAGLVYSSTDEAMAQTEIEVNSQALTTTDSDGYYAMELENGEDYTITPTYDFDVLNGVTTYDQVLISKHILGVDPIEDPYAHIAADANGSGLVTTSDIVEIRKLILGITDSFPNLESWRFVDANYEFPNPMAPWEEAFPEVINLNNLSDDVLNADFIGIKVGDVNGSASL